MKLVTGVAGGRPVRLWYVSGSGIHALELAHVERVKASRSAVGHTAYQRVIFSC